MTRISELAERLDRPERAVQHFADLLVATNRVSSEDEALDLIENPPEDTASTKEVVVV